jgi:hypothetical protein
VHIKFKDWSLNQPWIAPNSHENLTQNSQQDVSCPEKKAPWPYLFFWFSPNKQKSEHQSESKLCNILDPEPIESLPTPHYFSLPASFKAACMNLQNK